jgi:hypothetical protein
MYGNSPTRTHWRRRRKASPQNGVSRKTAFRLDHVVHLISTFTRLKELNSASIIKTMIINNPPHFCSANRHVHVPVPGKHFGCGPLIPNFCDVSTWPDASPFETADHSDCSLRSCNEYEVLWDINWRLIVNKRSGCTSHNFCRASTLHGDCPSTDALQVLMLSGQRVLPRNLKIRH